MPVTDITLVYVAAIVIGLTAKRAVTLELAMYAAMRVFGRPEHLPQLENAFAVALASPAFFDKVAKLLPVAEKEASAYLRSFSRGAGEADSVPAADYYVRYAKHLNRQVDAMMQNGVSFDPCTAPPVNSVDV